MSLGNPTFADNTLLNIIAPQTVDNNNVTSAWVYAGNAASVTAVVLVGATDAIVTATVEEASDASGTGAKAVDGATATHSATDDNKASIIQVMSEKLDHANGFGYVRLKIAVADGTTGGVVAGTLMSDSRHKPVTQPAAVINDVFVGG